MPDQFLQFPPAEIRRHAGSVDGIADAVQTARGAVHEVTMDTQAYGQLCQFLPTILSPIFSLATGALNEAEDSLRENADSSDPPCGSIGSDRYPSRPPAPQHVRPDCRCRSSSSLGSGSARTCARQPMARADRRSRSAVQGQG
jgi:hypothetical protein